MKNIRRDSSPPLPVNPDLEICLNELSCSNSDSSSLTVEHSRDLLLQIENSTPGSHIAWTNEKHNMYLDHLESSFVEQLHQSTGVLAWYSGHDKDPYVSSKQLANERTSEQLNVVQDGCLQKIDLKRSRPILNHAVDSLVVLKSHFRCAGKRCFLRSASMQGNSILAARVTHKGGQEIPSDNPGIRLEQISEIHENWLGCIGEFSDQNFADEEGSATRISKRLKTSIPDVTNKDQIVPVGNFKVTEISTVDHVFSQRGDDEADQE